MPIKRLNVKSILADPDARRKLMISTIQAVQARENVRTTPEQAERAYYVVTEAERAAFFALVPFRSEAGEADGRHVEFARSLSDLASPSRFDVALRDFTNIEGAPLAYDRLGRIGAFFREFPKLEPAHATAAQGLATADDPRFVRCWWEVPTEPQAAKPRWRPFAKGGDFSRFYADIYLMVFWEDDGAAIREFPKAFIRNEGLYFRPGLTWPLRTAKGFNIRKMPPGCVFGHKGPAIIPNDAMASEWLLGILNSRLTEYILYSLTSLSWEVGVLKRLPIPSLSASSAKSLGDLATRLHDAKALWDTGNEVSSRFDRPWLLHPDYRTNAPTLMHTLDAILGGEEALTTELNDLYGQLNDAVYRLYGVNEVLRGKIEAAIGERPPEVVWPQMEGKTTEQKRMEHVCRLLTYAVKCVLDQDDDGLVALQPVAQEPPLLERVRAKLASFFPLQDQHTLEIELVNELKKRVKGYARAESLHDWLTDVFFDFHCTLYQKRPILWHLASSQESAEPAFSVIVHYHRFDHDRLAKLRSVHVRDRLATLRREAAQAGKDGREDDRLQLLTALEEVEAFDRKLARLQEGHHAGAEGGTDDYRILTPWKKPEERPKCWRPDLDDGVKVNIAPLARTGLLRTKNKFGAKELED